MTEKYSEFLEFHFAAICGCSPDHGLHIFYISRISYGLQIKCRGIGRCFGLGGGRLHDLQCNHQKWELDMTHDSIKVQSS